MGRGRATRTGEQGRAVGRYALVVGALLVAAIAVTTFQQELGLAEPSDGGRAAVAALLDADRALAADADYVEYSAAVKVALVANDRYTVRGPVDAEVHSLIEHVLVRYSAAREAWQIELEGEWEPETHGDPCYWRAAHPGVDVAGESPLAAADVKESCREEATVLLEEILELVAP